MAELSSSAKRRQRARRTRSNLWETAVTNTPAQGCNTAPNNDAEMEIKALREQLAIAKVKPLDSLAVIILGEVLGVQEREVENTAARTHAEMEVKALKKELESAKGNVTEIITSLADAEKEIEALKKKVETAEERDAASRSAAEKEIGILKDQFAKVKRDAENGELASKERTRSLQCQLEETKRRMSELADENVRHISDVSRAEEETRRIMEDLQKTRAEAYEKITALQTQISQYDNQNVHDTRDSGFPGSTMSNRTSRNLDGLSTHSVPSTVCLGNAIGISSVSEGVPGRKNTTPSVDQM
ncbi:Fibrinogen- and Ig-binding protein precursor, putative [Perkinsus marinus ATCC 50983]|uniref:Fibrinogen-and Ig-binding protein, putative n=1 Tax=Perkinsus marinus (strain ATCC 50983 / TXsc) TaxID=423536 RepID=C5LIV1_PERM5|nr:Fibrinogen- and Ig-binding protein precursor, putative [Perkinsus marinus ATCC 50983]EER03286.1 Fibrinogen- and Ig-binding protein precursor, putative [Perkinsus marinus ATCC 50983]|eukprot:XP_002771470.1 Fibrinogen- and Ig-binding protein precursor, putative [Perkinsus marinus ATCC 50983]